jgi:hypothetical protein
MDVKRQHPRQVKLQQPTMQNDIEECLRLLDVNEQYHPSIKDAAEAFRSIVYALRQLPFSKQSPDTMDAVSRRFHGDLQESLFSIYEEFFSVSRLVCLSATSFTTIDPPGTTYDGSHIFNKDDNNQGKFMDSADSEGQNQVQLDQDFRSTKRHMEKDQWTNKQFDKKDFASTERRMEKESLGANEKVKRRDHDSAKRGGHTRSFHVVTRDCDVSTASPHSQATTQSSTEFLSPTARDPSPSPQTRNESGLGKGGIVDKLEKLELAYALKEEESSSCTPTNNDYSYYGQDQNTPKDIESVVVDASVTRIDYNAFYGCKALTSIDIPPNVNEISEGAFEKCSSLRTVALSTYGNLHTVGMDAFSKCKSLKYISIPATVEHIGEGAFQLCSHLTTVDLSRDMKLRKLDSYTFCECKALKSILLPPSVEEIGRGAFYGCLSLTSIDLTSSSHPPRDGRLQRIGTYAFAHCRSLSSIEIPLTVKEIGDGAFYRCAALMSIRLPVDSALKKVGLDTFSDCVSLQMIDIPASVKELGSRSFSGCLSLKRVVLAPHGKLKRLGEQSFHDCKSLKSIELPPSVRETGKDAFDSHISIIIH